MITFLQIRNLALIKECQIELTSGLNIISGETGSGKTLVINAVSLLFGERSDKSMIRTGENKSEIYGIISVEKKVSGPLINFLKELEIEYNDSSELHIRRIIGINASRQLINDTPVSINTLEKLGNLLIDFHRPEHAWNFFKDATMPLIIDSYGKLNDKRGIVRQKYNKIIEEEEKLKVIQENIPKVSELDYLKYVVNEILKASIIKDEDTEIESKYNVANNAKDIMVITEQIKQTLYDSENSAYSMLSLVNRNLSDLASIDQISANELYEESLRISSDVKDLFSKIEKYSSKIELDEDELMRLEERLSLINSMKKKYGGSINSVLELLENAQEKLNLYGNATSAINLATEKIRSAKEDYVTFAKNLTISRKAVSLDFCDVLKNKLKKLGFNSVEITPEFSETQPSENGSDKIDLMFSANLGEKEKLIQDIASSGEQSRIILGIKAILKELEYVPILVFDEIDANIGGEIGKEVGKELKNIGKAHQVICISHLPQVASFADTHFKVFKKEENGRTVSAISSLNKDERVSEIARMLGGGKSASIHAKNIVID